MNQSPPAFPFLHHTMVNKFVVQSKKYGSLSHDEIFNLHLGSGAGPWVSIPCLLQNTSHIDWFHPPKTINQKKGKNPEIRFHSQQIVSICSFPPLFQHVDLVTNSLSPGFCVCRRRQYETTWWEWNLISGFFAFFWLIVQADGIKKCGSCLAGGRECWLKSPH